MIYENGGDVYVRNNTIEIKRIVNGGLYSLFLKTSISVYDESKVKPLIFPFFINYCADEVAVNLNGEILDLVVPINGGS